MDKFTLYLMNKKGLSVLNAILEAFGSDIINEVVSARSKGMLEDYYLDIQSICNENNIPFYDKQNFDSHSSYGLAVGWRWILDFKDLVVLHDSCLPRYRGFAPLVSSLINGEEYLGVSAIWASEKYDTGPIISQLKTQIAYPIKIYDAINIVIPLYEKIAINTINNILNGVRLSKKQDESQASYSMWRDEKDYRIDWSKDSEYIRRFIDAIGYPYKGALSYVGKIPLRIHNSEEMPDVFIEGERPVGKVIFMEDENPVVICGKGLLKLKEITYDNGNKIKVRFKTRFE